jgi:hypothetical protein
MARPLKEELENRVPWLFQDLGFRVTHHDYSDRHMGDSVAELQSDSLRIRFIRDKSRIQVELASLSEPERWLELGFLWYALTGHRPEPELEGLAWFLRDHLSALQDALGPGFSQTKQQFRARAKRKQRNSYAFRSGGHPSRSTSPFQGDSAGHVADGTDWVDRGRGAGCVGVSH